jgi:hypothetical protein
MGDRLEAARVSASVVVVVRGDTTARAGEKIGIGVHAI